MKTFNVLDPSTNVFGPFFLEASAGTGKTFAIENVLPRLLLESSPSIRLNEILVVTFTRAATRELRTRIYTTLLKMVQALEAGEGGPPYLAPIYEAGAEAMASARRKLEEALSCFDQAQIFTLHGFCLKALQEFAFEAKFVMGVQEEDVQLSESEWILSEIKDFLRRGLHPDRYSLSQLQIVLKSHARGGDIEALCRKILEILQKGNAIQTFPTARESWTNGCLQLQALPRVSHKDLWEDFHEIAPKIAKSTKWFEQVNQLFQWIEKGECSYEDWDALLLEKKFFLEDFLGETISQKKGAKKVSIRYPGLFNEAAEKLIPIWKEAKDPRILLLRMAKDCQKSYERIKQDLFHFQPDDLVKKMEEALKESFFKEKVRSKYQAAIIDEFQDTDPLQWNIFKTLFLNEKSKIRALYLVGDPKQSIYAFRNADVYTFLEAATLLGEDHQYCLDTNYRSHPQLIQALNELFTFHLPEQWMPLPIGETYLKVRKVGTKEPFVSQLEEDALGRVHFFIGMDSPGREKKWPREETEELQLFPFIAEEILRLRSERNFSYQQIAILVKDRFQAMRLQHFLKNYEIPCFMQKNIDFEQSAAYQSMRELFEALLHPSHESTLKKFLGGCLVGKTADQVLGGWENSLLQMTREYFIEAGGKIKKNGFGAFFQDFLLSSWGDGSTVVQNLLSRKDPSLYFELRQICQILLENKPEWLHDIFHLYDFLLELIDLPSDHEFLKQFSEEEEDQVIVMTIHKSKGLEFDIVFALGLCYRHTKHDHFIAVKQEPQKLLTVPADNDPSHRLIESEMDAEKMRHLYVALTRAKERVYIPIVMDEEPKEVKLGTAAAIELLCASVGMFSYSLEQVYHRLSSFQLQDLLTYLDQLSHQCSLSYQVLPKEKQTLPHQVSSEQISLFYPPFPSLSKREEYLLSFSTLAKEKKNESTLLANVDKMDDNITSPHTLPLGADTGTLVHSILERICKADLHRSFDERAKACIEEGCKATLLEGWESVLAMMFEETFQRPLLPEGPSFRLCDIPAQDMQIEMEFVYPYQNSLLKGFIDLVFRYQGKYYLLDWKTNFLGEKDEDYSQERMRASMEHHDYFLQASIYASALKKFLRLFEKRPFQESFGGVIYLFLRGRAPYFFQPDTHLLEKNNLSERIL